ncbi:MAG: hypothetical protein R2695_06360 [Acidimicrobiales bacterium]
MGDELCPELGVVLHAHDPVAQPVRRDLCGGPVADPGRPRRQSHDDVAVHGVDPHGGRREPRGVVDRELLGADSPPAVAPTRPPSAWAIA